jgi:hypothetical protein
MISSPDLEIRTRSVPTAGHLLALGFQPLGIVTHPNGTKTFRFSPDAREALERFLLAKQKLDAMLANVEPAMQIQRPAGAANTARSTIQRSNGSTTTREE